MLVDPTDWILLAQAAEGAGKPPQGDAAAPLISFLPTLVFTLLLGYLLLFRPQRQEQAKRKTLLESLKKNDRVVTEAGIFGVVTDIRRELNQVTLRIDENSNTRMRVTLGSIARIVSGEDSSGDSAAT